MFRSLVSTRYRNPELITFLRAAREFHPKIEYVATEGTAEYLGQFPDLSVKPASAITGLPPQYLDGAVKTLDSSIHAGFLAKLPRDAEEIERRGVPIFDMLIADFKRFAGDRPPLDMAAAYNSMDVGGPALVAAAAKNHERVLVITSTSQFEDVYYEWKANKGQTTMEFRHRLAGQALTLMADYYAELAYFSARHQQGQHYRPKPVQALEIAALAARMARL